ncbi:hypothetical protein EV207_1605 [Scopulibacillus darangshiensis]|uniref:DUF4871 domain-containing protein n=1 Tax=Scopulibacillus darangshiensis TaxID=442528 RepID=A0A4R2NEG7_9BACL|nr:hypothetical protein [Scopulibacillus darangshiensis]TCP19699.1 hypothetical protein EV207_1605 [Scopulibacillus darangshiensis]
MKSVKVLFMGLLLLCSVLLLASCASKTTGSSGDQQDSQKYTKSVIQTSKEFDSNLLKKQDVKGKLGKSLFKKIKMQYNEPLIKNTSWKVSPTFNLHDKNGFPTLHVQGIKNRIAFTKNFTIHARNKRDVSKIRWLVLTKSEGLPEKEFTAFAIHKNTGKTFLLTDTQFSTPNPKYTEKGVYGSALTKWEPFPSEGFWRIDVFIKGKYFDSLVIKVHPK